MLHHLHLKQKLKTNSVTSIHPSMPPVFAPWLTSWCVGTVHGGLAGNEKRMCAVGSLPISRRWWSCTVQPWSVKKKNPYTPPRSPHTSEPLLQFGTKWRMTSDLLLTSSARSFASTAAFSLLRLGRGWPPSLWLIRNVCAANRYHETRRPLHVAQQSPPEETAAQCVRQRLQEIFTLKNSLEAVRYTERLCEGCGADWNQRPSRATNPNTSNGGTD